MLTSFLHEQRNNECLLNVMTQTLVPAVKFKSVSIACLKISCENSYFRNAEWNVMYGYTRRLRDLEVNSSHYWCQEGIQLQKTYLVQIGNTVRWEFQMAVDVWPLKWVERQIIHNIGSWDKGKFRQNVIFGCLHWQL